LFTFLRSLFVVHDWNRPEGSTVRSCRVCGRREELDIDDGVNLAAWYPVWKGYAGAHFARRKAHAASLDARVPTTGAAPGMAGHDIAASPVGTPNVLARAQSAGD
jgi:hypothetical protein